MTETVYAWAPITKAEEQDDGTVMVYGPAADAGIDRDRQRLNQAWLDKAMPRWMAEGGNVREQHDPMRAVGVGVGLTRADNGSYLLTARIVDDQAVKKIKTGVLKGFSVGIKGPLVTAGKADAPNGEVVGGDVCEVSVCDRPSNPRMLFTLAKADGASELAAVEDAELLERADLTGDPFDENDVLFKFVSAAQRRRDAGTGVAMPNGDFPISDEGHLRSAIGHLGNYNGDRAAAKRHIITRARALGLTRLLPDDWNVSKADQLLTDLAALVPDLGKADAAGDIATAHEAIAAIGRLIQSEAQGLADGRLSESCDIDMLIQAVDALKRFIAMEQREQPDDQPAEGAGELDPGQRADDYDVNGDVILMADEPDTTKTDAAPTARPLTKTEFADMLKSAVAEATQPLGDRLKTVEAELVKALAAPAPGGPVQTRTAAQAAGARATDSAELRTQAQQLLAKADRIGNNDPSLASGYRERAAELLAKADA